MASSTMDHMVSVIVFIAALMVFFGLFGQTNQTAITYERHRALSTKTSDLLDNMLLNPGIPNDWGKTAVAPTGFGIQDPEFTQYQMSAFSLMRLSSSTGNLAEYDKSSPNILYSNISDGNGGSLLTPTDQTLNYSTALALLGINGTYGFQLTLTPDITVSITQTNNLGSPFGFSVTACGTGFSFVGATVDYCLVLVNVAQSCPSYSLHNGVATADQQGMVNIAFPSVDDSNQPYALVVYAHLAGVVGVGYKTRCSSTDQTVVPLIGDVASQQIALAHSYDINNQGPPGSSLSYNATFLAARQDFSLSELFLDSNSSSGLVTSGTGNPAPTIYLPSSITGILVVTYQTSAGQGGVALMPWGVSSLGYPVTFGGNPAGQDWVATDIRQVTIGGVAYQAKLGLWNMQGVSVISR